MEHPAQIWRAACLLAAWEVAPDIQPDLPVQIEKWIIGAGSLSDVEFPATTIDVLERLSGVVFGRKEEQ